MELEGVLLSCRDPHAGPGQSFLKREGASPWSPPGGLPAAGGVQFFLGQLLAGTL